MKPLKKLKYFLSAILCSLQISCATPPPDVFVFEHLGQHLVTDPVSMHLVLKPSPLCMEKIQESECGHGVSIVTGREVYIGENKANLFNEKAWSKIHSTAILVPAVESYAPLSTYIINTCKKMDCSDQVDAFKIKLDSLNGVMGAIQNPP